MILYSKPVIEAKKHELKDFFSVKDVYIAILLFGNDQGSKVYVANKVRFGGEIGCGVKIFDDTALGLYTDPKELIVKLNNDITCVGIIIQLPLPQELKASQQELCDIIDPNKDIDCMTSAMLGKIVIGSKDAVYPAAVGATIEMLKHYQLDNLRGKQVSIIGQSNLVGKPMALYCINQGAQVHVFGIDGDPELMKEICRKSDYILSATGAVGLVDSGFLATSLAYSPVNYQLPATSFEGQNKQVLIDIGYGFTAEGRATGDVKFDEVKDLVYAISPVPGGVGPMCVCQLFENTMKLIQN